MGSCSQEAPPRGSCGFSPGGIPVASSSEACRSGARLNDEFYTAEDPRRGRKTDERGDILIGRPHPQAITAERPDEGDEAALVEWLTTIVRGAPSLMRVLLAIRALDLPDWLIMSGAVYQRVLNALTKRPPDYGVRDYDVGYFDASDISYEAEDGVIRRVAGAFDEPLRSAVEVRNQARVHVWFEGHFGEPYTPLSCTAEALERFLSPMFAVGVRLKPDDRLHIAAPFGLTDLFTLRLRPNPCRLSANFSRIAVGVACRWPEVRVEGAIIERCTGAT
jgi:uncharacterized protein